MKKILYIVDDFSKGGTARVVNTLIRGLNTSEFEPMLACLDSMGGSGENLVKAKIKVFCLERRPGFDWKLIFKLANLIRGERISLVHAHQPTAYFYGGLAVISGGRVPLVFTEHGRHYPDVRKPLGVFINRAVLLPHTSAVTAVSEAVRESLYEFEGIPREKVRVLVNGIDLKPFMREENKAEERIKLGFNPDEFLIGMVARLGEEKDHATLIKAMPLICGEIPNTRLLIIGDGPKRAELEALAAKLNIEKNIIFTDNRRDIPQLLNILDLSVLSSYYEGASITLLEAMGAGLPVIASRVGGNPLVVEENKTAFLFAAGDYNELAQKAVFLLRDKNLRENMGLAGRERALRLFSREEMINKYEEIYKGVIK